MEYKNQGFWLHNWGAEGSSNREKDACNRGHGAR